MGLFKNFATNALKKFKRPYRVSMSVSIGQSRKMLFTQDVMAYNKIWAKKEAVKEAAAQTKFAIEDEPHLIKNL